MILHARQAAPWRLLGVAAVLVPLLLRTVEASPFVLWPLQGIAVGLVGGTAAWVFDEPAAALVDTLPRDLAWRTTARSGAVVLLLGCWLASVAWTREAYFGHGVPVALQGVAAMAATTAYATWLRRRGHATPGGTIGPAVVAGAALVALARPFDQQLPVFPFTATDAWTPSTTGWVALAGVSAVVLALAVRGPRRPGGTRTCSSFLAEWTGGPTRDLRPPRDRGAAHPLHPGDRHGGVGPPRPGVHP